jgi:hypothetical protein
LPTTTKIAKGPHNPACFAACCTSKLNMPYGLPCRNPVCQHHHCTYFYMQPITSKYTHRRPKDREMRASHSPSPLTLYVSPPLASHLHWPNCPPHQTPLLGSTITLACTCAPPILWAREVKEGGPDGCLRCTLTLPDGIMGVGVRG